MKAESKSAAPESGVERMRGNIEHTQKEMSETLTALEERLSPGVLSEKANAEIDHLETRVKSIMKEGIDEAKAAVAVTLKEGVQEAKDAVTEGLKDARETVKRDIQDAITHTKQSVREATLGRAEDFATKAGDVMNDSRDTLIETVRQNPIPAALAGIGIAWLFMNRSSESRRQSRTASYGPTGQYPAMGYAHNGAAAPRNAGVRVGRALADAQQAVAGTAGNVAHRVGDMAGQLGGAVGHAGSAVAGVLHDAGAAAYGAVGQGADAVTHLTHDATAAAGRLAHDASEGASRLAQGAAAGAGRLENGVAQSWNANPLAYGAVAIVAGAALGYALPRTQKEDSLMGEARDQAVHSAAALAGDAVRSLEHLANDTGKKAQDAAKSISI